MFKNFTNSDSLYKFLNEGLTEFEIDKRDFENDVTIGILTKRIDLIDMEAEEFAKLIGLSYEDYIALETDVDFIKTLTVSKLFEIMYRIGYKIKIVEEKL